MFYTQRTKWKQRDTGYMERNRFFKEEFWSSPSDLFNLRCSLDIQEEMSNRQLYGVRISREMAGLKILI